MIYNYVLQTAPNAEFKARTELERLGLDTVMPVQFKIRRSRNRRQKQMEIHRPMMPGYVVIRGLEMPFEEILAGARARRTIEIEHGLPNCFEDGEWWQSTLQRIEAKMAHTAGLKYCRGLWGHDNCPVQISDEVVEHIRQMETLPNDQRSPFKPGDEVTIIDSPWNNGIIKVESITDRKAQVIFEAFGAKRKATVSVDKLEAA